MNLESLNKVKISRKRFLQLSALGVFGMFWWSPFKGEGRSFLPANVEGVLGKLSFSKVEILTQAEYDAMQHDGSTLYIVT